ncbi:IS607 family transposase, partial [Dethiothermospora halolimnae]|uniref:IS607 family transposase n=1 Tax=Dethiothermospora halolimnae TaxID=3114390 RepID=UPI003CCC1271
MSKKLLNQKQACEYLNISRSTILRWEDNGVIDPIRTAGRHRRYRIEDLDKLINKKESSINSKNCLIYARVSTKKQQKSGNLDRQSNRLMEYAIKNKFHIVDIYKEVASGINENRKELIKLLDDIKKPEINYLIIEYRDRLARFGYKYLEKYCNSHYVKIIVLKQQDKKYLNSEMVEDMISIITSFSARIYGKRGGKKVKDTLLNLEKEGE